MSKLTKKVFSMPGMLTAAPLRHFVEKPDLSTAEAMVESGRFLWNAGIFLFTARSLIAAAAEHAPDLVEPVRAAVTNAKTDLGFLRLDPGAWATCRDVSIDYAVMERADNLVVVPYTAGWSDLGGWDAVWRQTARDADGVGTSGAATTKVVTSSNDAVRTAGTAQRQKTPNAT